jgi:GNAT superfamily N-acetyltransferase
MTDQDVIVRRARVKGMGVEQVEVTAYAANTDAIRFYERRGFAPETVTLRRSL